MGKRENEKIGSVTSFIIRLAQLGLDSSSDQIVYFRGHSNLDFKLEPSIYREENWIKSEHRMFREIIMKCPKDFDEAKTTFEKLVKMQHYSLPTRLLDLTSNPLAALFFAVKENRDKDAEVIIFRVPKEKLKYYDSDTVSVMSNLAKRPIEFDISTIKNLPKKEFNAEKEIVYLLHEIKEEKPYFSSGIVAKDLESVVCVKPKLDNPRIIRQDGAFFIFGIKDKKKQRASIPQEYLVTNEQTKIIINKTGKNKILKQLEALGINESTMFPEIDTVSQYIKSNIKNG